MRLAHDPTIQHGPTAGAGPAKQGRSKGNARKNAKKSNNVAAQATVSDEPGDPYKVSMGELLRLADYLKDLGQSLLMPKRTWRAFKEAIKGRQQYADKFAAEQPDHEANATHVYFIEVLRRILVALQGCVVVQDKATSNKAEEGSREVGSLSNLFFHLSTDANENEDESEGDEEGEQVDSGPVSSLQPVQTARYEPNIDKKVEDQLLLQCFMDDAEDVRIFVLKLWNRLFEKADDAPSLQAATFITEIALEHLNMLEEAVMEKVGKDTDVSDHLINMDPKWNLAYATIVSIRDASGSYPLPVKYMAKRLGLTGDDIDPIISARDTFLIQYASEYIAESVSQLVLGTYLPVAEPVLLPCAASRACLMCTLYR